MKKVLVVLLVIGLLAGAIGVVAGTQSDTVLEDLPVWSGDTSPDPGVAPCGGGNGGGGAPG